MSFVVFRVCAKDPDGTFETCMWSALTYPVIGDMLMVPDGTEHAQDASVTERVIFRDIVEVWLGGFDGWDDGSVSELFKHMRAALVAEETP